MSGSSLAPFLLETKAPGTPGLAVASLVETQGPCCARLCSNAQGGLNLVIQAQLQPTFPLWSACAGRFLWGLWGWGCTCGLQTHMKLSHSHTPWLACLGCEGLEMGIPWALPLGRQG